MRSDVKLLAGIFAIAGVGHFIKPKPFESIIPRSLPAKTELVYASGAAEIACAVGLAMPRTRRVAGWASAGLLLGVFPANITMTLRALRSDKAPWWWKLGTIMRLPLQAPLIAIAWRAARTPA